MFCLNIKNAKLGISPTRALAKRSGFDFRPYTSISENNHRSGFFLTYMSQISNCLPFFFIALQNIDTASPLWTLSIVSHQLNSLIRALASFNNKTRIWHIENKMKV